MNRFVDLSICFKINLFAYDKMAQGLQFEQDEMVTQQTSDNQLNEQFDLRQESQTEDVNVGDDLDMDDYDVDFDIDIDDSDDDKYDQLDQLGQLADINVDTTDYNLDLDSEWTPDTGLTSWVKVEWTWGKMFGLLVQLLLGLYAAKLSWTCNTKIGYSFLVKLLSAVFAWFGGILYILYYLLLRTDICRQYIK